MSEPLEMFNDIEDVELRARNRAIIMANIYEDNLTKGNKINALGAKLLLTYFSKIPEQERVGTYDQLQSQLSIRGFSKEVH